jgi:hypothetical protein
VGAGRWRDKESMNTFHIIAGKEIGIKISEALGIDPDRTRRIVLDIGIEGPIVAYVELLGDRRLLQVDWTGLHGATIEIVDSD